MSNIFSEPCFSPGGIKFKRQEAFRMLRNKFLTTILPEANRFNNRESRSQGQVILSKEHMAAMIDQTCQLTGLWAENMGVVLWMKLPTSMAGFRMVIQELCPEGYVLLFVSNMGDKMFYSGRLLTYRSHYRTHCFERTTSPNKLTGPDGRPSDHGLRWWLSAPHLHISWMSGLNVWRSYWPLFYPVFEDNLLMSSLSYNYV